MKLVSGREEGWPAQTYGTSLREETDITAPRTLEMPCLVTHSPPPQSFHPTQTLQQQLRRSRADLPVPEATGFRSSSDLPRPSRRAGRRPIGCFEPNYVSQEPLDVARTWSVTSLSWKDGASLLFSVFSVEAQRK